MNECANQITLPRIIKRIYTVSDNAITIIIDSFVFAFIFVRSFTYLMKLFFFLSSYNADHFPVSPLRHHGFAYQYCFFSLLLYVSGRVLIHNRMHSILGTVTLNKKKKTMQIRLRSGEQMETREYNKIQERKNREVCAQCSFIRLISLGIRIRVNISYTHRMK